ncbi:MAG: sulfatase-like hydrolase/transferase [Phycisphaeraceae bacterium]
MGQIRRVFAALLLLLACGFYSFAAHAADRPNIVLIMADDMGYECVTANGGQTYKTPNLDKLAAQGVRFTNGHSQPICTPSRVQIMTGRYNSKNYIRFGLLDPDATTFANRLRDAGYATCIVGKWQLKGGFEGPNRFGFDEYCLWQLIRRPNRYPNPGLEINGKEVDYKNGEYGPDVVTDYACDFIDRHAEGDKPFLLYYPMMLPHWPFEPTPDSEDWDPEFRRSDEAEKGYRGMRNQPHFVGMVAYTDKMVGKLLAKLDAAGVRDNTLVIFTGDNGTYAGITSVLDGKPYKGGKGTTLINGTHVPLLVDWPGKAKAGSVCEDLIDFTDVLPTLLGAAGVDPPKDAQLDGRSFLPQVLGEPGDPRAWVYCWYKRNGDEKVAQEFAMDKRYKLYSDGRLFDYRADPAEAQPIAPADRTAEQRAVAKRLEAAIKAHTRVEDRAGQSSG